MKCKHCNGTGKSNMYKDGDFIDCMYCGGKGEIEMELTNEEWFCQLSTEEKADFLANIYPKSVGDALIKIGNGDKERWVRWLKEKHNESV